MAPLQQIRGLGRRRKRSLGIQDIPNVASDDSGSLETLQSMVLSSLESSRHHPDLCRPCRQLLQTHQTPTREHAGFGSDFHKRRRMGPKCEHEHHVTLSELHSCQSCELCILIHILIFEDTDSAKKTDSAYRIQLVNDGSRPHRYLKISFRDDSGNWTDKKMIIACWENFTDQAWTWFRSLGNSTSSEKTFELVESWLGECMTEHTNCSHSARVSDDLPTRLVEVNTADMHGHLKARLCRGEMLPEGTEYATLSHCWGKEKFATLTTENMQSWMASLPTELLPRTFRDAMIITWRLGYRYLWIDSLCIIQNSEEDWMQEAGRMSEVYQNSVFTISATASQRATDGLFKRRPPYLFRNPSNVGSGTRPSFWSLAPRDLWDLGVESRRKLGLPRRAWALQERVLSRRILHYSSLGVFWECDKLRRSELVPDHSTSRQFAGLLQQLSTTSHETPSSEWHRHWASLIKDYSERQLTYPDRDKLAALSGVAKAFQFQLHDEAYVAGLWNDKEDLLRNLMWSAVKKTPRPAKPIYRAPSWSWASLDAPVSLPLSCYGHDLVSFVDIQHAQTKPLSAADPMGRLVDGFVTFVGFCVPTVLSIDRQRTRLKLVGRYTTGAQQFWQKYRPVARLDYIEPASSFPRWVFCVPWFSYDFTTRDKKPRHRVSFLLLEPAKPGDQNPRVFRRVGTAESWSFPVAYKWDLMYFKKMTVVCNHAAPCFGCSTGRSGMMSIESPRRKPEHTGRPLRTTVGAAVLRTRHFCGHPSAMDFSVRSPTGHAYKTGWKPREMDCCLGAFPAKHQKALELLWTDHEVAVSGSSPRRRSCGRQAAEYPLRVDRRPGLAHELCGPHAPASETCHREGNHVCQALLHCGNLLPVSCKPMDRACCPQHKRDGCFAAVRRLSKGHRGRLERQLPPPVDAGCRLQHLLFRQALERTHRFQLQRDLRQRIQRLRFLAGSVHVQVLRRSHDAQR